jgi:hypothetical protein
MSTFELLDLFKHPKDKFLESSSNLKEILFIQPIQQQFESLNIKKITILLEIGV